MKLSLHYRDSCSSSIEVSQKKKITRKAVIKILKCIASKCLTLPCVLSCISLMLDVYHAAYLTLIPHFGGNRTWHETGPQKVIHFRSDKGKTIMLVS